MFRQEICPITPLSRLYAYGGRHAGGCVYRAAQRTTSRQLFLGVHGHQRVVIRLRACASRASEAPTAPGCVPLPAMYLRWIKSGVEALPGMNRAVSAQHAAYGGRGGG